MIKVSRIINNRETVSIFRETIIQQLVHVVFGFYSVVFIVLYEFNVLLLEKWDLFDSSYIVNTIYPYCMINVINMSSLGIAQALVFGVTKDRIQFVKKLFKSVSKDYKGFKFFTDLESHSSNRIIFEESTNYDVANGKFYLMNDSNKDLAICEEPIKGTSSADNNNRNLDDFCNSAYNEGKIYLEFVE